MKKKSPETNPHTKPAPAQNNSLKPKVLTLSTLLALYAKPYKGRLLLTAISVFGAAGVVLSFGRIVRDLIDTGSLYNLDTPVEGTLLAIFVCIAILALFSFGRSYGTAWLSERIMTDIRMDLFRHMLTLDVGYYEQQTATTMVSRMTTDITLIQTLINTSVPIALRNLVLLFGSLGMMITLSIKLTALALILVPIILVAAVSLGRRTKGASKQVQDKIANIASFLEETFQNIRTCYAFTHEDIDRDIFSTACEDTFQTTILRNYYKSLLSSFVILLSFGGICGLVYIGIQDVQMGVSSAGVLSSFMFFALLAAGTAGSFSENYAEIKKASGAADRLIELMYIKPTVAPVAVNKRSHLPSRGTLAVHNVNFSYNTNPNSATLKDISFTINPGEKVAIVGPSGAGKSTIFALLMRFYDPQSGSIYIDGHDYTKLSLHDIRHRIGLAPQDPTLFSATLFENIIYGMPDASMDAITHAIQVAQLHDVIATLPQGIHTPVGPRGVHLSGGQKQRVSIARAVLRDPVLLLLDEATSALDAENEHAVQEGLKYLTATRSSLVIAHRLSTVLNAERIIVMDQGCIQGIGTHAELCESNALYRRLATLQFFDGVGTLREKDNGQRARG